jgi:hypothetical protein
MMMNLLSFTILTGYCVNTDLNHVISGAFRYRKVHLFMQEAVEAQKTGLWFSHQGAAAQFLFSLTALGKNSS